MVSMGRNWEVRGREVRLFLPSSFAALAPGSGVALSLPDYSPCQVAPPPRLRFPWAPLQFLLSLSHQFWVWKHLSVVVRFLGVSMALVSLPTSLEFLIASSGELFARNCFLLAYKQRVSTLYLNTARDQSSVFVFFTPIPKIKMSLRMELIFRVHRLQAEC